MLVLVGEGRSTETTAADMERDFDSKLRLQNSNNSNTKPVQRAKSFAFRAPQENFTIHDFQLGKIYGVGSYSKVVRAKKKDTGNIYALKIMDKKFITKENKTSYVKLERVVLDQLDHPGIVRLFFTFQDTCSLCRYHRFQPHHTDVFHVSLSLVFFIGVFHCLKLKPFSLVLYLPSFPFLFVSEIVLFVFCEDMALESCEGGELFDQITRKGRLSEDETRFYAAEVIDALEYIHGVGLIHRDIKPENLLLTAEGHIKIADFGSIKPMKDSRITFLPSLASDEKACTFVGTAAYVPPEVLNSSPPTFGNDMWALGCTLYQMLSGSSPFKDASEWLIFQRIIARDLRFPDYFSEEARDLIDKLLDTDPSKRPGAGPDGYAALKKHPFFKQIDWKILRMLSPPRLALDPNASEVDDVQDSGWNLSHVGDGSARYNDAGSGATSSSESYSHITRLASIDSFDSRWQQFLDPGEAIVMISTLKKINKLSTKKVQLILTDKPKLICIDPARLMLKGNIIWSDNPNDLNIQVLSSSHFKLCTPKKVRSFEDAKQRAWQWKKAIEGLQNR